MGSNVKIMKNILSILFVLLSFSIQAQQSLGNFNNIRVNNLTGLMKANGNSNVSAITDGTSGQVLTTDGAGTYSFQTPSSVSFGTSGQIPHMNSGGTDFLYSDNLKFDGTQELIKDSNSSSTFSLSNGIKLLNDNTSAQWSPSITFSNYNNSISGNNDWTFAGQTNGLFLYNTSNGTTDTKYLKLTNQSFSFSSGGQITPFNSDLNISSIYPNTSNSQYIGSDGLTWDVLTVNEIDINNSTVNRTVGVADYQGVIKYIDGGSANSSYTSVSGKSGGSDLRVYGDGSVILQNDLSFTSSAPGYLRTQFNNSTNYGMEFQATSTGSFGIMKFYNSAGTTMGSITSDGTSSTSFVTSSDARLKFDEKSLPNALHKLSLLKPYQYKWKSDSTFDYGFFAHELQEILPRAVVGKKDEVDNKGRPVYQGIDYGKLTPLLTAALQELSAKVDSLENTTTNQAALIEDLFNRVTALENK